MNEHTILGRNAVSIAIGLLTNAVSIAIAWSCSSFMLALVVFIISSLVLGLLAGVLIFYVQVTVSDENFERVGAVIGRCLSMFKRA